nr:MAG: hypothetical protein ADFBMEEK_00012 [Peromyscus leucopus gammaherpesvirus]
MLTIGVTEENQTKMQDDCLLTQLIKIKGYNLLKLLMIIDLQELHSPTGINNSFF